VQPSSFAVLVQTIYADDYRGQLRTTSVADQAAATDRDAAIARAEADNASGIATAGERADQAALGADGQEPEPEQRQRQRSSSMRIPLPRDLLRARLRLDRPIATVGLAGGRPGRCPRVPGSGQGM